MSKIFNVGVVGYGFSAKIFHIPFINDAKAFKLYAVVQRHPKPEDDAAKDWPGVKTYKSTDDLVKDDQVNVIVLTTNPATHFDLAAQAIKAGKHVLVEKPFTPTSKEAYELVSLAQQHKVLLTVYQNRRYDADFQTLRQVLDQNALGRVADFETHFDRHRPDMPSAVSWKTDPTEYSAIFDLGTHLMDQVVAIYGLPKKVTGFVGTQRGAKNTVGLEDAFTAIMHYDDMTATAKASVVSAEENQLRYWIRGEAGSFKKYHLDPQEDQLKAGSRPGDKGYGEEPEDRYAVLSSAAGTKVSSKILPTIKTNGYTGFYDQWAKALQTDDFAQLPVDPKQSADVIRLIELVRQSSKEERTLTV